MINRPDRDKLIHMINQYLSEEITAFEFDDLIGKLASKTQDETVDYVVSSLWEVYDNCEDHKVVATNCTVPLRKRSQHF